MDKMKLIPPNESAAWLAEFHDASTDVLKRELVESLGLTARGLLRCACIVHVLEERGEDLTAMQIGIINFLRKIACGQLLPEVVVRFAGNTVLLKRIENLPIADQRRLATGSPVALLVLGTDGGRTIRQADPLKMTAQQVKQAFAGDHIRDEGEQALLLDDRREQASRPLSSMVGPLRLDPDRDGATCGRTFVSLANLEEAVRQLKRRSK